MFFYSQTHRRSSSTCLYHGLPNRKQRYQDQSRDDIYEIGYNASCRNIAGPSVHEGIRSLSYEPNSSPLLGTSTIDKNVSKVTQYGTLSERESSTTCCGEDETFLCHGNHVEPCGNKSTGHVGLSLALTFHAVLEGLAIGLQRGSAEVK